MTAVELHTNREGHVGSIGIQRGLPRRARRTVGPWCLADHMGPADFTEYEGIDVPPHPHIGLQTVTWLFDGEALHRDSLGSEQIVRAGQLNLMSAGRGIAHSEERTGRYRGRFEGFQLWVAQPDDTRNGPAAFEHHAVLPVVELGNGEATVMVGAFAGAASPARRDSDHFGADLDLRAGGTTVPVRRDYEHAILVARGALEVEGVLATAGTLAYLHPGLDEVRLRSRSGSRALLLGGVPLAEPPVMWWNFVGRSLDDIEEAYRGWEAHNGRFGDVRSALPRASAPVLKSPGRPSTSVV